MAEPEKSYYLRTIFLLTYKHNQFLSKVICLLRALRKFCVLTSSQRCVLGRGGPNSSSWIAWFIFKLFRTSTTCIVHCIILFRTRPKPDKKPNDQPAIQIWIVLLIQMFWYLMLQLSHFVTLWRSVSGGRNEPFRSLYWFLFVFWYDLILLPRPVLSLIKFGLKTTRHWRATLHFYFCSSTFVSLQNFLHDVGRSL